MRFWKRNDNIDTPKISFKPLLIIVAVIVAIVLLLAGTGKILSRNFTIEGNNVPQEILDQFTFAELNKEPKKESNRLDILLLGMRGEGDAEADTGGALLTDTILLFSFNKDTGKSSLVSIPRDLYLEIENNKVDKINTIYERGGLGFAKKKFSELSGVYIDHIAVLDFSSFKEIIDAVGGVDIVLAEPFTENAQWGYSFSLPAGTNHLDGQNALYYARSRFSSSDFDRAQRQQKIILALKDKLLATDFFSDPLQTINIFNSIQKNVKTDIGLIDINNLLPIADSIKGSPTKFVISTENLVYQTHINGIYVLLPNDDSLEAIQALFKASVL